MPKIAKTLYGKQMREVDIDALQDFKGSLSEIQRITNELIDKCGEDASIQCHAAQNNVSCRLTKCRVSDVRILEDIRKYIVSHPSAISRSEHVFNHLVGRYGVMNRSDLIVYGDNSAKL